MASVQAGIPSREWSAQTSLRFWDTNGSPNLGQTTRPSDNQQKKNLTIKEDHRVKLNEDEKRDKYIDLPRALNKLWNLKVTVIKLVNLEWSIRIGKEIGRLKNQWTDHPDYSITKIGQNTKKSLGDLRRLAVTQSPWKIHQLTLV